MSVCVRARTLVLVCLCICACVCVLGRVVRLSWGTRDYPWGSVSTTKKHAKAFIFLLLACIDAVYMRLKSRFKRVPNQR